MLTLNCVIGLTTVDPAAIHADAHASRCRSLPPILMAQGSCNALLDQLRERLAPAQWPLPLSRLPEGTALVGGAVRDGLLDRLQEHPDLDLVVHPMPSL